MKTIRVKRFKPATDDDGPFGGEVLTEHSPAIALKFDYDRELIDLVKGILGAVPRSGRGRGRSYGWSKPSRCWWVRSYFWPEVRQALLAEGVHLTGQRAHPKTVVDSRIKGEGFFAKEELFERQQEWDSNACKWRWTAALHHQRHRQHPKR